MRVANVYDIDNKTYLIRLGKTDVKVMLLVESGNRINTTEFEWPKNMMPSGFSMKCRKHIRSRRLVNISQLGIDRIVDLQFGSDEAAYHLIVELYDRGNIFLTDYEYTILSLLRTRTDADDVKFAVREKYPVNSARQREPLMNQERVCEILSESKEGVEVKKVLNPHFVYGAALIEHCLMEVGFPENVKIGKGFNVAEDLPEVMEALKKAESFLEMTLTEKCNGVIVQKKEQKRLNNKSNGTDQDELLTYQEFYPFLLNQHKKSPYLEFPSFDKAVDEFFSKIESQKIDMKALSQEKTALKKLENIRKDHQRRIDSLQKSQDVDMLRAELVELNLPLVEKAILIVNSAIANQIDWSEINNIVKEAQSQGDPVACAIGALKLETNHISMHLRNPYDSSESDPGSDEEDDDESTKNKKKKKTKGPKFTKIDINLALSAYANARSFYDKKKFSSKKEQKTIDASEKALKSAERKTKETLKEVETTTRIKKARKTYWFEKFLWFISSENYLVIGGRDQQQNELVVKRHLEQGDVYVHADLHGATSVIIKNPTGQPVPPKTLNEAGCMAVSYSAAWEARIVTSAWWVHHSQVSKTAPSGEYLTTGSFMIRGKKNFLPPCYLMMGFGFLFKLDETSIENHLNERKVRAVEDTELVEDAEGDEELSIPSDEGEEENPPNSAVEGVATLEEDDEEDSLFPDTSIDIQLTKEGKVQLQRGTSRSNSRRDSEEGETVAPEESKQLTNKQRLSAKQRRENRKKKARQGEDGLLQENDEEEQEIEQGEEREQTSKKSEQNHQQKQKQQQQQQQPPKRGQKTKLKKIKEKYGEQDEEERQMKMEILASAGPSKESKADKRKKDKKAGKGSGANRPVSGKSGRRETQTSKGQYQNQNNPCAPEGGKSRDQDNIFQPKQNMDENKGSKTNCTNQNSSVSQERGDRKKDDIDSEETANDLVNSSDKHTDEASNLEPDSVEDNSSKEGISKDEGANYVTPEKEKDIAESDDEAEDVTPKEAVSLLDSLTGCPISEDLLLFAIPVCAPYGAVQNYKFKVKLTPGTARRGKAAKTALSTFLFSKEASQLEKDLIKSLKDNDLSRYIPGKVKVSAPNLQKKKKK